MMHLTSKWWCSHIKNDIFFSLQAFIHMAFMIYDKSDMDVQDIIFKND
jgi:hypothetical protein